MKNLLFIHLWGRFSPRLTMLTDQQHVIINILDEKDLLRVRGIIYASQSQNKCTFRKISIIQHFSHLQNVHWILLQIAAIEFFEDKTYSAHPQHTLHPSTGLLYLHLLYIFYHRFFHTNNDKKHTHLHTDGIFPKTKISRTHRIGYYGANDIDK